MTKHLELGKKGEDLAVAYLIKKGYQIIHRNYRCKHLELDVICKNKNRNYLVIVEVKARTTDKLGPPEQITRSKQKLVIRATNAYIQEYDVDDEIQFDVIGIILNQHQQKVQHIEDAFYP